MTTEFEHVVVADISGTLDLELMRHAARIRPKSSVLVVTPAGAAMLQRFASVVHRVFEAESVTAPAYRVVPEPEIDSLLLVAEESKADLLTLRYSAEDGRSRSMARHLLRHANCSVWLLPSNCGVPSEGAAVAVIESPAISPVGWALRRDGIAPYLRSNLPLLYVQRTRRRRSDIRQIWRDIFSHSEPTFN